MMIKWFSIYISKLRGVQTHSQLLNNCWMFWNVSIVLLWFHVNWLFLTIQSKCLIRWSILSTPGYATPFFCNIAVSKRIQDYLFDGKKGMIDYNFENFRPHKVCIIFDDNGRRLQHEAIEDSRSSFKT